MPQVPRYDSPQVQSAIAPTPQRSANVSPDAFNAGKGFNKTSNLIMDYAAKAKADADQVVVSDRYSQLTATRTQMEWDAKDGFYAKQGQNAINSYPGYSDTWNKKVEELGSTLSTSQLDSFKKLANNEYLQMNNGFQRHLSQETRRYDDTTYDAGIKNDTDSALQNFRNADTVEAKIGNIQGLTIMHAQRAGYSPEETKLRVSTAVSSVRAGVINRFLNQNDDLAAKELYERTKDQLVGDDAVRVEKALEVGSLRGQSQRLADQIQDEKLGLGASIERAKVLAGENAQLRDQLVDRVRQNFQFAEQAQQDATRKRSVSIANLLEASAGDLDKIPPGTWQAMPDNERDNWRKYSASLRAGVEPKTNFRDYYDLKMMAANPETRGKFMSMDLFKLRNSLGNAEFDKITNIQTEMIQKNGQSKELDDFRTKDGMINVALRKLGIDPNSKKDSDNEVIELFKQRVANDQRSFQESGKKITNEEFQKILDNLSTDVIIQKRDWLPDSKKKRFELSPDQVQAPADIPRAELQMIKSSNTYRKNPSDATIMKLYRAKVSNLNGK